MSFWIGLAKEVQLCNSQAVGRLFLLWMVGLSCVFELRGQLLDARLDSVRNNFVLNEQVVVSVHIRNNSDQLAVLGNEKIGFSLQSAEVRAFLLQRG